MSIKTEDMDAAASLIDAARTDMKAGRTEFALRKLASAQALLANQAKAIRGIPPARGTVREHSEDWTGFHD